MHLLRTHSLSIAIMGSASWKRDGNVVDRLRRHLLEKIMVATGTHGAEKRLWPVGILGWIRQMTVEVESVQREVSSHGMKGARGAGMQCSSL
jgi:phosphoribosylformimino-5-aminoimidazole carboxamide ribonucleotide (ProFAR) isomerase